MNTALLFGSLITVVLFAVAVVLFCLLWNSTFPELFRWPRISLWTAFKILLISALLFGGIKLPFNYGCSTTADHDGAKVTTSWSIGSK